MTLLELLTIISIVFVIIHSIGDKVYFNNLKKGFKRIRKALKPIVVHPLYRNSFLGLCSLMCLLICVLGIIFGFLSFFKYYNIYISLVVGSIFFAMSLYLFFHSIVLYNLFPRK